MEGKSTSDGSENDMASTSILKTRQAKQALRVTIQKALRQVSGQSVEHQSFVVTKKLLSLDVYQKAKSISIFLSMPAGEIVTRDIVHDSLEKGKTVYVPYLVDTSTSSETKDNKPGSRRRQMDMVSLHFWADFQRCEENRDRWGIPTISSDSLSDRSWILNQSISESQKGNLDLVVVPGQAFDRQLRRLGHGKGFYDSFLSSYRDTKACPPKTNTSVPFLIGLALTEQLLPPGEIIPVQESDWNLDALIVGDSTLISKE